MSPRIKEIKGKKNKNTYIYHQKVIKKDGEKGIAGIHQGITISFIPLYNIKSQKIRNRINNIKIGKKIDIDYNKEKVKIIK